MASGQLVCILHYLRRLTSVTPDAAPSDAALLEQFVARRDGDAFALLVERHGPMVYGVCRRMLLQAADAEDAFQATFLILARKAASIRRGQAVAAWLHEAARHIAARARADAARRRARERQVREMMPRQPFDAIDHDELRAVLDEELATLPVKYRTALVLCDLEGRTHQHAARELGCPPGSISWRLGRARELLRQRLTQRGITVSAAALAAVLSQQASAAMPALLTIATVQAALRKAGEGISATVAALTEEGMKATGATKAKTGLALVLSATLLAAGMGVVLGHQSSPDNAQAEGKQAPAVDNPEAENRKPKAESQKAYTDLFGDPLPPGALVRMGTIRLRQPNPRMVFSSDGKSLTSVGSDNTVRTWDVATGKYLRSQVLEGTSELDASAISMSPDGKALLVWKYSRKSMLVYDVATGKQLGSVEVGGDQAYRAALAPGGKAVAASTNPGIKAAVRLWVVTTGAQRLLVEHKLHDENLAFSPDGKLLVAAGRDALRVWDVATNKLVHSLSEEAWCLTFSPDSKTMASGNLEGTVKLWDMATGKERATLRATPASDIQCLAFAPDGKVLAAGGARGVRLWDVGAGKMVRELPERMGYELAFAPDGKVLAASGGSSIRLWDVVTGNRHLFRHGHNGQVDSIASSPNGRVLASTSNSDFTLCLWDAATGRLLHQPPGDQIAGRATCFSADGKLVPSGGHDGFVHLWETDTGKERRRFPIKALGAEEGNPFIDAMCLSADGKRIAAVARFDRSSQINIWDVATGKVLTCRPFEGHGLEVFTPDGQGITVRVPEGVTIQDTVTGKRLVTFAGIVDMLPIAFSPDSKLVALTRRKEVIRGTGKAAGVVQAGGERMAVSVVEAATGKEVLSLETGDTRILPAFSADGRMLATADYNIVRVWDVASGKEIYRRARHEALPGAPAQAAVTSVALLPGGRALATGLMDGTILVWELVPKVTAGKDLGRQELDGLWADLAGDDARKAYQAIMAVAASPRQSVSFLKDRLRPVAEVDRKHAEQLLADLDSEQFAVRDAAAKALAKLGERVESALRRTLDGEPSAEVRKRVETLLAAPRALPTGDALRALRAIQALEHIGTPEANQVLQDIAKGIPEARLTREAKAALDRLTRR